MTEGFSQQLMTTDVISLSGLRVWGKVGVLDFEKKVGQPFIIDARLEVGYSKGSLTDELKDTVNYAEVCHLIQKKVEASERDLIEALTGDLAEALLASFPSVLAVELTCRKPFAPIQIPGVEASFSLRRQRWNTCYVGMGSNLGDRKSYLVQASECLSAHPQIRHFRCSSFWETEPWGKTDQPLFLNGVCTFETTLNPWQLLTVLQTVEEKAHRQREEHWGPRTLDLDLLNYGEMRSSDSSLILPHPYQKERDFVQIPLKELTWAPKPMNADQTPAGFSRWTKSLKET